MPRLTNRQLDLIQTKIKEAIQAQYEKVIPEQPTPATKPLARRKRR